MFIDGSALGIVACPPTAFDRGPLNKASVVGDRLFYTIAGVQCLTDSPTSRGAGGAANRAMVRRPSDPEYPRAGACRTRRSDSLARRAPGRDIASLPIPDV